MGEFEGDESPNRFGEHDAECDADREFEVAIEREEDEKNQEDRERADDVELRFGFEELAVFAAPIEAIALVGIPYEDPSEFEYTPGKGISAICEGDEVLVGSENFLLERGVELAQGNGHNTDSEVFVARSGKLLGTLVIADTLRPEAKEAVQSLKDMRLRTVLLTGDAKAVAEDIGKKLGVDEVASELLPEEKLQYVVRLTASSHTVAMSETE